MSAALVNANAEMTKQWLLSLLTPAQALQLHDHHSFDVSVNDRVYRICAGRSYNVHLMAEAGAAFGKWWRYCLLPDDGQVDIYEVLLSQLLMLTTDEARFLRIANRTEG